MVIDMNKIYIAKRELSDQDWKTQLARGYGNIPKGAKVEVVDKIRNFYGTYCLVRYNGIHYYVNPNDLEVVCETEDK